MARQTNLCARVTSWRVKALFREHLRLRLMLWIVLIPAPPLLLTVWFGQQAYTELAERMHRAADQLARQTATTLNRILYERERDAQFVSSLPAIKMVDPPRMIQILNQAVTTYAPYYRLMIVVGKDGAILAANDRDGRGQPLPGRPLIGRMVKEEPWFAPALSRWRQRRAEGTIEVRTIAPDPLVHEAIGQDLPVMRLAAPVWSEQGSLQAVWVAWVDGAIVLDALRGAADDGTGQQGLVVSLFDRDDRILGLSGQDRPGASATVLAQQALAEPGLGWTVKVFPASGREPSRFPFSLPVLLLVGGTIAGGAILLGWLATRQILDPLERLAKEAEIYAAAKRGGFTIQPGRADAIGWLQKALAAMTQELETKTTALKIEAAEHRRAEREARTAQRSLDMLLAQSPDLVVFTQPDGTISRFNRGAERLLGYAEAEVLGQPASCLYAHGEDRQALVAEVEAKGEVVAREVRLQAKDGCLKDVSLTLVPLQDAEGGAVGLVGFGKDITELKQLERDLKMSNQELEHFTFSISHDLQTPLRGIHGFADLLLRRAKDRLQDKEIHYLVRMRAGADRMAALINDLLDLSRIGRIAHPPEACDMGELVAQARSEIEPLIKKTGARIQVERPLPVVEADRIRLIRVWVNLLSNAVKFVTPGAPPTVTVGAAGPHEREDRREWTFFVRDNGIGIAPAYHQQIFEIFRRLHTYEEYEGTGAGLAIVKRVVEFHGGRVWVESQEGEGSTFWFTLPEEAGTTAARADRRVAEPR